MGGVFRSRDGGDTWDEDQRRAFAASAGLGTTRGSTPTRRTRSRSTCPTCASGPLEGRRQDLFSDRSTCRTATTTTCGSTPDDPLRMIEANDGGANVSYGGGETWSTAGRTSLPPRCTGCRPTTPFPTACSAVSRTIRPIRIRSSLGTSARAYHACAIGTRRQAARAVISSPSPDDPDVVYGGSYGGFLTRFDHRTGERRAVNVWPDNPMGWGARRARVSFPVEFSLCSSPPTMPDVLYAAAQCALHDVATPARAGRRSQPRLDARRQVENGSVRRTRSPRTTPASSTTGRSSPPSSRRSSRACSGRAPTTGSCTFPATAAATGVEVTPPGMPEWMLINSIEAHPFEAGGLYVAGTRYKSDDFRPYLYRTTDGERAGRRSPTGSPPTTSRASSAPIRSAAACSTPARRAACTCPSTTAPPGSRCSSSCRSCQSPTWR